MLWVAREGCCSECSKAQKLNRERPRGAGVPEGRGRDKLALGANKEDSRFALLH